MYRNLAKVGSKLRGSYSARNNGPCCGYPSFDSPKRNKKPKRGGNLEPPPPPIITKRLGHNLEPPPIVTKFYAYSCQLRSASLRVQGFRVQGPEIKVEDDEEGTHLGEKTTYPKP